MDETRFDEITRALTGGISRRGVARVLASSALGGALGSLLGLADVEAKRKKRKKKKKKKRKPPTPPQPPPPSPPFTCQGQADGTACSAGRICAQGQCVTGQGTCTTGEDFCKDDTTPCGTNCLCWTTKANQTRCGENISITGCNTCANDADCAGHFPDIPGASCVQDTGHNCQCGGFCVAPCCQGQADGAVCASGRTCQGGTCACATDAGCAAGQRCLPNGSCAIACTENADCSGGCLCGPDSLEGPRYCVVSFRCEARDCASTAQSPRGFYCGVIFCGAGPEDSLVPLCTA